MWNDTYAPYGDSYMIEVLELSRNFFSNQNFSNSIVYIHACNSWSIRDAFNAMAYLGYDGTPNTNWSCPIGYYFFYYMMKGYININPDYIKNFSGNPPTLPHDKPMSVKEAWEVLGEIQASPDPKRNYINLAQRGVGLQLNISENHTNEEIYFPVPVTITIEKH